MHRDRQADRRDHPAEGAGKGGPGHKIAGSRELRAGSQKTHGRTNGESNSLICRLALCA